MYEDKIEITESTIISTNQPIYDEDEIIDNNFQNRPSNLLSNII